MIGAERTKCNSLGEEMRPERAKELVRGEMIDKMNSALHRTGR